MIWVFYAILFLVGLYASYQDIKTRRIPNATIVAAFLLSIAAYTVLTIEQQFSPSFMLQAILSSLIALALGMLLWYMKWWGAGDAKFFSLLTLIAVPLWQIPSVIPLQQYIDSITNATLPLAAFLCMKLVRQSTYQDKKIAVQQAIKLKTIFQYLLAVFSLAWVIRSGFQYAGIEMNIFLAALAIYLLQSIIQQIFKEDSVYFLVFLSILHITVSSFDILKKQYLISLFGIGITYVFIRTFLMVLSSRFITNRDVTDIRVGDVLAQDFGKKRTPSTGDKKTENTAIVKRDVPLTANQVKWLQQAYFKGTLYHTRLLIKQTIPFAPFLFIGTLLTVILKTNIVSFFITFF